ncbi:MAG: hypothetical protein FWE16_04525 [Firmicutes bacterium]|nr:hypothetical protein [Bacillota bacterium]
MKIEQYEIHDDWNNFFDRRDYDFNNKKYFSLTAKFTVEERQDKKFDYMVYFTDGELLGSISDLHGQNFHFDDYEDKEKNRALEYDCCDGGNLQFKFKDITMSPKAVLFRLKEIANNSGYLTKIAGKKKYLC